MLNKRLIVCLDVRDKKVTKGIKFKGNVDIGDPVEMACQYVNDGVDELVFYDITASAEGRPIDLDMVRDVAENVFIPLLRWWRHQKCRRYEKCFTCRSRKSER